MGQEDHASGQASLRMMPAVDTLESDPGHLRTQLGLPPLRLQTQMEIDQVRRAGIRPVARIATVF